MRRLINLVEATLTPEIDIQVRQGRNNRYSFRAVIGDIRVATGEFQADQYGDKGSVEEITVNPEYRRQGIATKIYDHFEKMGFKVVPSDDIRDDGRQFWNNRGW